MPTRLKRNEIEDFIDSYLFKVRSISLNLNQENPIELFTILKRNFINEGPYPNVTIFEAANRIMTDLTILFGLRKLFEGAIPDINFNEYSVEFGNENQAENDISAKNNGQKLIGEAFNVSKAFFQIKKSKALKKMRATAKGDDIILLIYNSDAIHEKYKNKWVQNEYHLVVDVNKELKNTTHNNG